MKSLKSVVGVVTIAGLVFFNLAQVAHAATITLRSSLDSTPRTLAASMQGSSCATRHTDAALAGTPFYEAPLIAQEKGDKGTSIIQIDLLSNGALGHYALAQSSGNSVLDDSALRTARMTKYQPETQDCVAVAGSYLLQVDF